MRRKRVLATALFLIFLLALFHTQLKAGASRLQLSETSWDWGRVPQSSVVSHKFWIKNMGTDILKGISVHTP